MRVKPKVRLWRLRRKTIKIQKNIAGALLKFDDLARGMGALRTVGANTCDEDRPEYIWFVSDVSMLRSDTNQIYSGTHVYNMQIVTHMYIIHHIYIHIYVYTHVHAQILYMCIYTYHAIW